MKRYVIGLAFSSDLSDVVLIRKNRPEWQAGKLNGVGGKIEGDELPEQAMRREYREETGVPTATTDWRLVAKLGDGRQYEAFVFAAKLDRAVDDAQTMTDEEIHILPVKDLLVESLDGSSATIFNVPWLILMARQMLKGLDHAPYYTIEHS